MRKSVQDSLTTFLSNQTIAAQPPRPIDQFTSFKMKRFDTAKKKANDNKRKDLINAYDQNDSKGLCELVGYFSGEELCSFGSDMYFGNTLLIPRINQLADAATSSQKDLEEAIGKLRIAQKLPLKISVKHKQVPILQGSTLPK